jgi:NAD(P)H-flavin reductase
LQTIADLYSLYSLYRPLRQQEKKLRSAKMPKSPFPTAYARQSRSCGVLANAFLTKEIFRLDFSWPGPLPRAGQFFMIKPKRSSVFLSRPVSAACRNPAGTLGFFVALKGKGTHELSQMKAGDEAELTGPLGNAWADFGAESSGEKKPAALVGGGIGVAPLLALARERAETADGAGAKGEVPGFDFYAGFRKTFAWEDLLEGAASARSLTLAFEERAEAPETRNSPAVHYGRITDFVDPADHSAVYACGPEPMLRTLAARCRAAAVPCYISLERHMACGVGACLGCTVETRGGNKRCCADGPIFPAGEIYP